MFRFAGKFSLPLLFSGLMVLQASHVLADVVKDAEVPEITEDAPEITIAPSVDKSWYLRGDVGYSFPHYRHSGTAAPQGVSTDYLSGDLKNTFQLGAGFGYSMTDYLRADATLDYSQARLSADLSGKVNTLSALANAYVDLASFMGFTPYLGAGLGGTYVKWHDLDGVKGEGSWRFTYAAMAGVSYDLSENLKLDTGYRFRHINGGNMFSANSGADSVKDRGFNVHDVRIGLRYQF